MYSSSLYKTSYDHFKTLHKILRFTANFLQVHYLFWFSHCFGNDLNKGKPMAEMNLGEVVLHCDEVKPVLLHETILDLMLYDGGQKVWT